MSTCQVVFLLLFILITAFIYRFTKLFLVVLNRDCWNKQNHRYFCCLFLLLHNDDIDLFVIFISSTSLWLWIYHWIDGELQLLKWKASGAVYKLGNNNLLYCHYAIRSWRHLCQMTMIALFEQAMDRASLGIRMALGGAHETTNAHGSPQIQSSCKHFHTFIDISCLNLPGNI
mgnify:CR=1 FL=1